MAEQAYKLEESIGENEKRIEEVEAQNRNLAENGEEEAAQIAENRKWIKEVTTENKDRKGQIENLITKVLVIENENNNLRQTILNIKMTEGSLETIFQTVIQLSLLFLALTGKKLTVLDNKCINQ